ncbi:phytanoyl-CoA dioxygenase family protein [Arenimonas sp. MALMAid1274]|uniref:phytanoyl-CoA dioxygenase family protein n=1 Tax=Arenimonas sp. MALMAid1274 TaxID=3411630 RepID=UPI003B9F5B10
MSDQNAIERDGYVLLRGPIPAAWLDGLRACFDQGETPSHLWPVPRQHGWRHSLVDLDPTVQAVCRLPPLLEAVGRLIGERFFLSQAEGREPLPGHGHQGLHRDLSAFRPGDTVNAMVFLDDYGPHNGATRFVPGSHRPGPEAPPLCDADEAAAVRIAGRAGDILVFDADLAHGASQNTSGERRRSLLVSYRSQGQREDHARTAHLRAVRMATDEYFDPPAPGPT